MTEVRQGPTSRVHLREVSALTRCPLRRELTELLYCIVLSLDSIIQELYKYVCNGKSIAWHAGWLRSLNGFIGHLLTLCFCVLFVGPEDDSSTTESLRTVPTVTKPADQPNKPSIAPSTAVPENKKAVKPTEAPQERGVRGEGHHHTPSTAHPSVDPAGNKKSKDNGDGAETHKGPTTARAGTEVSVQPEISTQEPYTEVPIEPSQTRAPSEAPHTEAPPQTLHHATTEDKVAQDLEAQVEEPKRAHKGPPKEEPIRPVETSTTTHAKMDARDTAHKGPQGEKEIRADAACDGTSGACKKEEGQGADMHTHPATKYSQLFNQPTAPPTSPRIKPEMPAGPKNTMEAKEDGSQSESVAEKDGRETANKTGTTFGGFMRAFRVFHDNLAQRFVVCMQPVKSVMRSLCGPLGLAEVSWGFHCSL